MRGGYVGFESDCWWNNDVDGARDGDRKYSALPGLTRTSADCLTLLRNTRYIST